MNPDDHELFEYLQALEGDLLKNPTRTSREELERLLSADFVEFGSSGRIFDRSTVIASLVQWDGSSIHNMFDFTLLRLAEDAALVTYRLESVSTKGDELPESLRSSLWIREDEVGSFAFIRGRANREIGERGDAMGQIDAEC